MQRGEQRVVYRTAQNITFRSRLLQSNAFECAFAFDWDAEIPQNPYACSFDEAFAIPGGPKPCIEGKLVKQFTVRN